MAAETEYTPDIDERGAELVDDGGRSGARRTASACSSASRRSAASHATSTRTRRPRSPSARSTPGSRPANPNPIGAQHLTSEVFHAPSFQRLLEVATGDPAKWLIHIRSWR